MLLFYLSLVDSQEDRDFLTEIFNNYSDWMHQTAFYFLKNEKDAEDAVGNVFLSIVCNNCSIPRDNEDETRAYLFICVKNSALRIKAAASKNKTVSLDDLFNLSSYSNVEESIINNETFDSLYKLINTMPHIYKDILTLCIVFDKPLKEAATILDIPFKTAETRYRRGLSIIKERFGDVLV